MASAAVTFFDRSQFAYQLREICRNGGRTKAANLQAFSQLSILVWSRIPPSQTWLLTSWKRPRL